ncbi:bifunctional DNA-formamidopyrimidine glycosylase/DNA-(apurinic or apyrimidinic site) lyase [Fodinicola acaciae]|uniref:bifunctional DNA-formamidopyrimidine glycosylase/DNA-(apurinic or apyrimidinic site) lyase n=1 Tax=Fodinicola acaciae TaxID=2681555 RepID=UPI0013CFD459|nr:bifunctional DNA-formamidopyrimidine glycosylase/DNA-(apurinic or apyrimidinic site) lyase [Fodinicola acaciae]
MPELPEVETVRAGLQQWVAGRTVDAVQVLHQRAVRREVGGAAGFADRVAGRKVLSARRRGKYLWMPLDSGEAIVGHLGMSGQLLVQPPDAPDETHLRIRWTFTDGGRELRFVDQRTFGGMFVDTLVPYDLYPDTDVPATLQHIAPDPLEELFSESLFIAGIRARRTGLKRALLDQSLISGVGNIYADEALWRAKMHYARPTETMTAPAIRSIVVHVRDVMEAALREGGTSFDSLYVDINGSSGYFDRSLNAYGQEGLPCPRCGTAIRRDPFMNRSSYTCPKCQPRPRRARW